MSDSNRRRDGAHADYVGGGDDGDETKGDDDARDHEKKDVVVVQTLST